jgi:hypothetical protein
VAFASFDFFLRRGRRRSQGHKRVLVSAPQQPPDEPAAHSVADYMVGDAEQPGFHARLAPVREPSTKGDDENIVYEIFEIRARPGQAPGPALDVGNMLLVQPIKGLWPTAGPFER